MTITQPASYESAVERLEEIHPSASTTVEAGLRETLDLCREGRELIEYSAGELGRRRQGPRGAEARRADRAARRRCPLGLPLRYEPSFPLFPSGRRHFSFMSYCSAIKGRSDPDAPSCFIEPQEAIRVVAESVGREARRQLLGEVVRAWVDEISR